MDYKLAINEILNRAARLGVAKSDLCEAGGVSLSTLYRWQQDDANPRLRDLTNTLAAMRQYLDGKEQELRDWLETAGSIGKPHAERQVG